MLYKIEIYNNVNNNLITFMTHQAWKTIHGSTCTSQDKSIAQEYQHYKLLYTNESGFYGLPTNSLVRQQGIRQNGTSFLSNSYEDRQLLFTAKVFKDLMNDIDIVMQQNQYSLAMLIYNEYDEYVSINVDCLGKYESGSFEFKSVESSFFKTSEITSEEFELNSGVDRKLFFPFKPNSIYFTTGEPRNFITVYASYEVEPIFKIYRSWENMTMTNQTTGEKFILNVTCSNVVTINSEELTIFVDNRQVDESEYTGAFPTLVGGENIFKFEFETAIYPIKATIEYQDKRASIL